MKEKMFLLLGPVAGVARYSVHLPWVRARAMGAPAASEGGRGALAGAVRSHGSKRWRKAAVLR